MSPEALRLDALFDSVADGAPVDWDTAESTAGAVEQPAVRHLRLVARIADLHRSTTDAAPASFPDPDEAAVEPAAFGVWGQFQLLEKIGEGAFSEVYRARDPWLDREVAVKLLKPSASPRLPPERIVDEARKLARVRHPNVVTVYGADVHGGRAGLWMELVRGRTLGHILASDGTFSASEAANIGRDLSRALAAVHAVGVVHQDVKAQNVMREAGGRYVLMDFGAGGTPLYLAPEVLAGGQPTAASDLYALGVLLFHLVTGRYPVAATSTDGLEAAHATRSRLSLAVARPELPDGFVSAIERALDPAPERRFANAVDMREALAGPTAGAEHPPARPGRRRAGLAIAAAAAAALAVMAAVLWRDPRAPARATGDGRSVAVLPFRTADGGSDAAIFGRSLSEDLEAQLARVASLRVVSGASIPANRATAPAREIGAELDVDAVVSGSVRVLEASLVVSVEVLEPRTAATLLTRTFERPRTALPQVQAELATAVAAAVKGTLTDEDRQRLARRQPDSQAFELYLRGRYYWNTRTPDGIRRSIAYFKDAITVDPDTAVAHAGLADAYALAAIYRLMPVSDAHALAEASANRATVLEPSLAQAHAAVGLLRSDQLRWGEAAESLQRAIALNPSYGPAHHWYGLLLVRHRRFEEALTAIRAARAADPFSYVLRDANAYVYYASRNYEAAAHEYRQVLDVDPANYQALAGLTETLAAQGALDQALTVVMDGAARTGRGGDLSVFRAYVYALAGRAAESRQLLEALESSVPTTTSAVDIACAYGALGDIEHAVVVLRRAVQEGDSMIGYLGVEPRCDRLRGDFRFDEMVRSVGVGSLEKGVR